MESILIAIFPNESEAIEANKKLNEFSKNDVISIFEKVLLKKGADGKVEVLAQQNTSDTGWKTLSGGLIGGLVGALAGPLGMILGGLIGTSAGASQEIDDLGVTEKYLSAFSDKLKPGSLAIVAYVDENDKTIVNSALEPLGAKIQRDTVNKAYEDYYNQQLSDYNESIAKEQKAWDKAVDKDKKEIKDRLDKLKAKKEQFIANSKGKIDNFKSNMEQRFNRLSEKESKAEAHQKEGFEKMKNDLTTRIDNFNQRLKDWVNG